MQDRDQTIVLITGANQGLGFEIARRLGTEHRDYHIIVTGRKAEAVDTAVAKLLEAGCSVEPLLLDLTSDKSIAQAAATVEQKHGHLDVLVNNAGISHEMYNPDKPLSRREWAAIFDTNVFGTSAVTEAFLPLLKKSKKAKRIVFMTSDMGSLSLRIDSEYPARKADWRAYSSSKSAVNSVALHFANQLEDDPTFKVVLCCPGFCSTNVSTMTTSNSAPESGGRQRSGKAVHENNAINS
jgi:NAD(P)-dependent dehydrogenase (short-subunit alcohol dehydrogenase family)